MNQLLFYLLQVIAASGLLYGYYHFALRNKRFHRYNRFYLLMAILISTLIPFLNIPVYFSAQQSESSVMLQTLQVFSSPAYFDEEAISASVTWFTFQNILYLLYSVILAVFLIRILFSLNKIRSLIRENTSEQLDEIRFVKTDEPSTPFSFFRWLFWNRKIELHSEKGEQIFRHELFHIQQKHSRDIIFVELLTVIFWINPFFHLIKRELKAIHEFLADEFAIKENNNWQYAELLLMQALNTNNHLVNPFFNNQIKRRVTMITTSTKSSYQYLRKLMVLPVATIIIFLFAFRYQATQKDRMELGSVGLQSFINKSNTDTTKPFDDRAKEYDKYLVVIDGVIQSQRGLKNIDSSLILKDGRLGRIEVNFDNNVENKYGEKGKDGVIEIYTDNVIKPKSDVKKDKSEISLKEVWLTDTTKPKKDEPLIVIDGKPRPDLNFSTIETVISVDKIESINVLKDKNTTAKYGDMAKHGVIEINTKKITGREITLTEKKYEDDDDNKVFQKVEIEASFPRGVNGWREFLQKNIKSTVAVENGAKEGTYTVITQFIVHKDGSVSDLKALTSHGHGMEDEALRVMKQSPNWIPAMQNGHKVSAYRKQPVTFVVAEDPKVSISHYSDAPIYAYLINPKEGTTINLADLKKINQLKVQKKDPVQNCEVVSFKITIGKPNPGNEIKTVKDFVIIGNSFSNDLLKAIDDLDSETIIILEDIKVKVDNIIKRLPPRIYQVNSITTTPD